MAFTPCSVTTTNITNVGTNVAARGLTTDQFKALFDKYGADFVAYFNNTHLAEGNAHLVDATQHLTTLAQTFTGSKTIAGLLNSASAIKADGNGTGLFLNSYSLILLFAVDKTVPTNYLFAVGYKGLNGTDIHVLTVVSAVGLSLGVKNSSGTQVISGGTATNIITYGMSIPQ